MSSVSRDILRAVLEARDNRHNETHAMLLTLFQCLTAELIEQGAVNAGALAGRMERARAEVQPDPQGMAASDMLDHIVAWLQSMEPGLPPRHPSRWSAPSHLWSEQ